MKLGRPRLPPILGKYRVRRGMGWNGGTRGMVKPSANDSVPHGGMEMFSAVVLVGLPFRPEMLPKSSSSLRSLGVEG